jgi:hypothetical protein
VPSDIINMPGIKPEMPRHNFGQHSGKMLQKHEVLLDQPNASLLFLSGTSAIRET